MQRFRRPALVLAAYLGTFLASLDISIVNLALPTLQQALHTDMAGLQWVINAYAIALSAVMLSAGPLVTAMATAACGCSAWRPSPWARCCVPAQGVFPHWWRGGRCRCGRRPADPECDADPQPCVSEARARARVIGGWSAFSALALVLGPLLGANWSSAPAGLGSS